MARKLKDIDVAEISLVDSAANRKKFFITKGVHQVDKFLKILKKLIGETEVTGAHIEKLKKLPEEAVTTLTESLEQIAEFQDDYPAPLLQSVQNITKLATIDTPETEVKEVDFIDELTDVKKAGARLSKATVTQLKKIKDIIVKILGDLEKSATGEHNDLPEDVVEKLARLDKIEKDATEKAATDATEKEAALQKKIEKMETEIETLKKQPKTKAIKTGLNPDETAEVDEEGKPVKKSDRALWPSIVNE